MRHKLNITAEQVMGLLPHGSGIDAKWEITKETPYTLRFDCSYHSMNDVGYYTSWHDFFVIISVSQKTVVHPLKGLCEGRFQVLARPGDATFSLRCRKKDLVDYLYETIYYSLGPILSIRNEIILDEDVPVDVIYEN
jgi:hypothetical protein